MRAQPTAAVLCRLAWIVPSWGRRSLSCSSLWLDSYHRPTEAADQPGRKPSRRLVRKEQLRKRSARDPLVRAGQRSHGAPHRGLFAERTAYHRSPPRAHRRVRAGGTRPARLRVRSPLSAVQDRSDRHVPSLQVRGSPFPSRTGFRKPGIPVTALHPHPARRRQQPDRPHPKRFRRRHGGGSPDLPVRRRQFSCDCLRPGKSLQNFGNAPSARRRPRDRKDACSSGREKQHVVDFPAPDGARGFLRQGPNGPCLVKCMPDDLEPVSGESAR